MVLKLLVNGNDLVSATTVTTLLIQQKKLANNNVELTYLSLPKGEQHNQYDIEPLSHEYIDLLAQLNISTQQLINTCDAKYHLGCEYNHWCITKGFESFILPFDSTIDKFYSPTFINNIQLRLQGYDINAHPDEFSFNTQLLKHNLSPVEPYHFPFTHQFGVTASKEKVLSLIEEALKRLSKDNDKFTYIESDISRIVYNDKNTEIEKVILINNDVLTADIYVNTCKQDNDFSNTYTIELPPYIFQPITYPASNQTIDIVMESPNNTLGHMKNTAMSNGWISVTPSQNYLRFTFNYGDELISKDQATKLLRDFIGSQNLHGDEISIKHSPTHFYKRDKAWRGNVINIGKAYSAVSQIASVQSSIDFYSMSLLTNLLNGPNFVYQSEKFNSQLQHYVFSAIDFQYGFYGFSNRSEAPYLLNFKQAKPNTQNLFDITKQWLQGSAITSSQVTQPNFASHNQWNYLLSGLGVFPAPESLVYVKELEQFNLGEIREFYQNCLLNFIPDFTPDNVPSASKSKQFNAAFDGVKYDQ